MKFKLHNFFNDQLNFADQAPVSKNPKTPERQMADLSMEESQKQQSGGIQSCSAHQPSPLAALRSEYVDKLMDDDSTYNDDGNELITTGEKVPYTDVAGSASNHITEPPFESAADPDMFGDSKNKNKEGTINPAHGGNVTTLQSLDIEREDDSRFHSDKEYLTLGGNSDYDTSVINERDTYGSHPAERTRHGNQGTTTVDYAGTDYDVKSGQHIAGVAGAQEKRSWDGEATEETVFGDHEFFEPSLHTDASQLDPGTSSAYFQAEFGSRTDQEGQYKHEKNRQVGRELSLENSP